MIIRHRVTINRIIEEFQLPTLEFKKFEVDVTNWLTFCGQFKKIDKDPEMDNADKF